MVSVICISFTFLKSRRLWNIDPTYGEKYRSQYQTSSVSSTNQFSLPNSRSLVTGVQLENYFFSTHYLFVRFWNQLLSIILFILYPNPLHKQAQTSHTVSLLESISKDLPYLLVCSSRKSVFPTSHLRLLMHIWCDSI